MIEERKDDTCKKDGIEGSEERKEKEGKEERNVNERENNGERGAKATVFKIISDSASKSKSNGTYGR